MQKNSNLSGLRRKLLPAGALVALALSAGMAQATIINVSSTSATGTTPTEVDNDLTRLQNAINSATPGQTIMLNGDFDITSGPALDAYQALAFPAIDIIGKNDLTINGNNAASITFPWGNDGFYINQSNDVTITNLTVEGPKYTFFIHTAGGPSENVTVTNNTIRVRHIGNTNPDDWFTSAFYLGASGSNSLNGLTISENDFELILHPALVNRLNLTGMFTQVYCLYSHTITNAFGGAADEGFKFENNNISVVKEGVINSADLTSPGIGTLNLRVLRDNSNSHSSNMSISGNTVNGGVTFDDDVTMNFMRGFSPHSRSGEFRDPDSGSRIRFNDNTFINVAQPYLAWRGNYNSDPTYYYVIEDNVFIDCGSPDPNVPLINNNVSNASWGDGVHGFLFNLDTQIINGGDTYTGIPLLNYMSDPANRVFALTAGGDSLGIFNAHVTPPVDPGSIVNNPDWTGLPRFSDPTGAGTLAMEYNAFGDPIDPGDPNRFVGLSDNETYYLTEDEAFPVGTVVRAGQTLTIATSDTLKSATRHTITPVDLSVTTAMFVLEDNTSKLVLHDVNISGDVPGLYGDRDSPTPFNGNGGEIELTNVDISDFNENALNANNGTRISASNVKISNVARALRTQHSGSTLSFEDGEIGDVGQTFLLSGGAEFILRRSHIGNVTGMFSTGITTVPGSVIIGGSPADGNLFMTPFTMFMDGQEGATPTGTPHPNFNMTHNWHFNVYGPDANNDGYIDGTVNTDALGVQTIIDGLRHYGRREASDIVETSIVATFDRDNDGLPDVMEFRLGTDFQSADTSNNGVPDGVMVNAGLDPSSGDIPAGWDPSDFSADTNSSGYVDWYEAALAELGLTASLGDLTGTGQVTLGDAIRGLQVINGAIDIYIIPNPNNLNVAGTNPYSLANPLQILRFQAGVRNAFPALPGIN